MIEKVNFVNEHLAPSYQKVVVFISSLYKRLVKLQESNLDSCLPLPLPCEEESIALINLELFKSKREITEILNLDADSLNFDLNTNFEVVDNFTVLDAIGDFKNFLPNFFLDTKSINTLLLRDKFLRYKYLFPELKFFNKEFLDTSLYSFVFHSLHRIDLYYYNFQKQELVNNGVHMTLKRDKAVLHLNTTSDTVSVYGGDIDRYHDIRIYKTYERVNSDLDTYKKVRFGTFKSIHNKSKTLKDVKYDNLDEYIMHYDRFGCMPLSFKSFILLYRRALFAEFAKPFLLEVFKFLETQSRPNYVKDRSDQSLRMQSIERFLSKIDT